MHLPMNCGVNQSGSGRAEPSRTCMELLRRHTYKTQSSFSIALIVIGIIGRIYAAQYSYVSPEGMVQDSAWLPIGTLMIVIGVLILIVLGIQFMVSAFGKE